jgi:D-sedoheptulose 7-phosphate isomerase
MSTQFLNNLREHLTLFSNLTLLDEPIERAATMIAVSLRNGGKLLLCGNGGSAADCQHIAAEFTGRFLKDRPPIAAISLTTDTSALSCIGND